MLPGTTPDRDGSHRLLVLCRDTTLPEILDELIIMRDVAMHRIGEPPDSQVSAVENAEIHGEMVTNFYLSHRSLAEDTPMPYGGTLAMTRLLDYTGLLHTRDFGRHSVYLVPLV